MDQLWAPWRMSYLNKTEPEPGCIFCNKVREQQDEANFIIERDEFCFVILNLYPYNSGHLMVVPYRHTGDFTTLPAEILTEVFSTAQAAMQAIGDAMHPMGYNLGINQGSVAGAGVADHVHLHIVPRWGGDTNFMPVIGETKVLPESLADTAAKLRSALGAVRKRT